MEQEDVWISYPISIPSTIIHFPSYYVGDLALLSFGKVEIEIVRSLFDN